MLTKSADATGDLIGSKIADKITSFKSKESVRFPQEKSKVIEKEEEIIIPPVKRQQILRLF